MRKDNVKRWVKRREEGERERERERERDGEVGGKSSLLGRRGERERERTELCLLISPPLGDVYRRRRQILFGRISLGSGPPAQPGYRLPRSKTRKVSYISPCEHVCVSGIPSKSKYSDYPHKSRVACIYPFVAVP